VSDPATALRIAIDIDDVTAATLNAAQAWAHRTTGVLLDPRHYHTDDPYWDYYNSIWKRHGLNDLQFEVFLDELVTNQGLIAPLPEAQRVIKALNKRFGVVFITSRDMSLQESTRAWIDRHIDASIPVYFAHNPLSDKAGISKGELCNDLGAQWLIDDSIDHCQNVIEHGVEAILFGNYGWNQQAPKELTRCVNWRAVEDYFRDRE